MKKISTLCHFSQSMTDYFAHDDAVEPALAVLCEVLRTGPEVGAVLKDNYTIFLGLAQKYQKLRSSDDRDFAAGAAGVRAQASSRDKLKTTSRTSQSGTRRKSRYPLGLCFDFQETTGCTRKRCTFRHNCATCDSDEHGRSSCPDTKN